MNTIPDLIKPETAVRASQPVEVLELLPSERHSVRSAAERLASVAPDDTEEFLAQATAISGELPERVRHAALRLRRRHRGSDALIIRGLSPQAGVDRAHLPPNPSPACVANLEDNGLLLISLLVGEPIGYAGSAAPNSVLRCLPPVPGTEETLYSERARLRTENNLYPAFPSRLALRAGSGNAPVELQLGRLAEALTQLSSDTIEWLERPLYWLTRPVEAASRYTRAIPVLYPDDSSYRMVIDLSSTGAIHSDALSAVEKLDEALCRTAYYFLLAPGDLALLNNQTTAHALHPQGTNAMNRSVDRLCLRVN